MDHPPTGKEAGRQPKLNPSHVVEKFAIHLAQESAAADTLSARAQAKAMNPLIMSGLAARPGHGTSWQDEQDVGFRVSLRAENAVGSGSGLTALTLSRD